MKTILMGNRLLFCVYRHILHQSFLFIAVFAILVPGQVFAEVSDGAHGGNEHFFFLPPLVPEPSPTGSFSASASPVVEICEYTGTGCVLPPIAEFTTTTGYNPERVRVVTEDERYIVNLNTRRFGLDPMKTYRIRVLFRTQEGVPIEKELGHADVKVVTKKKKLRDVNTAEVIPLRQGRTLPIKFRIEEGFFPIGELTPMDRAKISLNLQEYLVENDVFDPFRAIVKMADDDILDHKTGFIVLKDHRPILPFTVVQINTHEGIAHIAQDVQATNIIKDFAYDKLGTPSQDLIGQPWAEENGYVGDGAHVAVLDYGCDLTDPAFGDCTNAGDPHCSILEYVDLAPVDTCSDREKHGTNVAKKVLEAAPGARLIVLDLLQYGSEGCKIYASTEIEAMKWIFEHKEQYNIVAFNMSYGTYDAGAGYEILKGSYEKLHYRDVVLNRSAAAPLIVPPKPAAVSYL